MSEPDINQIKLFVNSDGHNRTYLFLNNEPFYGPKDPFLTTGIATFNIDIERLEQALKLPKGALSHLKETK